ncbi:MAG: hypothetical protein EBY16_01965 [Gammaproteobacteria bacterium]|nr:hypothetical protein [Gammaproteobacteria bacterium]
MNLMNSSEISLRAAVFAAKRDLAAGENFADKIRSQALSQLQIAQQAEGLFQGIKESGNLRAVAINAAVAGLQLAYQVISSELQEAKSKRQRFVAECETHLASFVIDTNKEFNELTKEEKAIRLFYKIAIQKCPEFIDYLGMNMHQNAETPHLQYYTVLPFYRMSQSLEQNGVIATSIDHHRQAIFLFLKTGLPLQIYYDRFKDQSKTWLQMMGLIHSSNYLNHLKAPRFIVTAIANLLWNLQHPVNIDTGIPLTLSECVNICYKAGMFLNDILNPKQFPFVQMIDDSTHHLHTHLATAELLLNSLHLAFDHERMHEINLQDVSKYLHTSLRLMSSKLLELIYHRENASEQLMGQIMIMGELFLQHHHLYAYFYHPDTDKKYVIPPHTNQRPCTLIDVIVIFTHLTPGQRNAIFQVLKASKQDAEFQLADQLKEFHRSYLQPFEISMIEQLQLSKLSMFNKFATTASYFIPILLLVMESFTVFKDTRPKKISAMAYDQDTDATIYNLTDSRHDRQQRQDILKDASAEGYYRFSLSCFLGNQVKAQSAMDSLLSYQNQIRLHTAKIDYYAAQIKENRAELLKAEFKREVIDYLKTTITFLTGLNEDFSSVEKNMLLNSQLHRDQKRILQPMFDELEKIIDSIQKSIIMVKSIMTSKDFDKNERERNQERLQFRFTVSPKKEQTFEGMSSSKKSMIMPREYPRDKESIEIQTKPSYLSKLLYYTALLQLGLIAGFFALNMYYHLIMLSFAMNLSIMLLGLGLPLIYVLYQQFKPQFNQLEHEAFETIFN